MTLVQIFCLAFTLDLVDLFVAVESCVVHFRNDSLLDVSAVFVLWA